MNEHVHEWMASSVGGVYLAICNSLDADGNATCEAQLTSKEIDERLNATEKLSAKDARFAVKRIEDHIGYEWDDDEGTIFALDAYADTREGKS